MHTQIGEKLKEIAEKGDGKVSQMVKNSSKQNPPEEKTEEMFFEGNPETTVDGAVEKIVGSKAIEAYLDSYPTSVQEERGQRLKKHLNELKEKLAKMAEEEKFDLFDEEAVQKEVHVFLQSRKLKKLIVALGWAEEKVAEKPKKTKTDFEEKTEKVPEEGSRAILEEKMALERKIAEHLWGMERWFSDQKLDLPDGIARLGDYFQQGVERGWFSEASAAKFISRLYEKHQSERGTTILTIIENSIDLAKECGLFEKVKKLENAQGKKTASKEPKQKQSPQPSIGPKDSPGIGKRGEPLEQQLDRTPKSKEEFELLGFKFTSAEEKKIFTNEKEGMEVEILDFDPTTGMVKFLEHKEVAVTGQEDGQNVVDVSGENEGAKKKELAFGDFQKTMEGFVLQESLTEAFDSEQVAESENELEKKINIAPGKIFRNTGGEKIVIVEMNPLDKSGQSVKQGYVKVQRTMLREGTLNKEGLRDFKIDGLKKKLAADGFVEVDKKIKIGKKGTIWEKGEGSFSIAKITDDEKTHEQMVKIKMSDGEETVVEANDLKWKIESEGWSKKKQQIENQQKEALNPEEQESIKNVFISPAGEYLDDLKNHEWGNNYNKRQVDRRVRIEVRKMWNIFERKIADSGLIREGLVGEALEQVKKDVQQKFDELVKKCENENKEEQEQEEKEEKQQEKVELSEQEQNDIEKFFVPFAREYIGDLEKFDWGEGYSEADLAELEQIEKDSFWGTVLPMKMIESTFIRGEATTMAIDLIQTQIEKEMSPEKNNQS